MDTAEIIVVITALVLIIGTLWFFFGPKEATRAALTETGLQEIDITVKGGYTPDVVVVQRGRPVRLNFFRDETSSCSEEIVIREFGIARPLPPHTTTPVEFIPEESGEFPFTCGMGMMRGRIVVEPSAND
jgi:plastocyanin domain-containing protein